jgi:2-succinyl-5-enolpyruvyl-6-hydroxy-3-cyclohexene-1-carboxylate synthase
MTAPNRATLWGRAIVEELVASGVGAVCLSPGSRSTPLTVAAADHPDLTTFSVLDERSAAYFALGRSRRSGEPTALVCTSGTAAANYHPAVIEAHQSRVPLVVLTADRPAELHDSGANQTVDQQGLYGDAVRFERTLPEPAPEARRLRAVRVAVDRAVAAATGTEPGPVHLNVPLAKPLEPTEKPGDVPESFAESAPLASERREGPFVRTASGTATPSETTLADLADALADADRGLVVAGPLNPGTVDPTAVVDLAATAGFPLLADPLSGLRFGSHVGDGIDAVENVSGSEGENAPLVCGGYDSYLDGAYDFSDAGPTGGADAAADRPSEWTAPEIVVRFGASPTSKVLRRTLRDAAERQIVVDPAGGWPEAEFTATDLVAADPTAVARGLTDRIDESGATELADRAAWRDRFARAERAHWDVVADGRDEQFFEGAVLATVLEDAPDPATVFLSNSMPVRDGDRFGRPRGADLTVLGNRGASGIDGIVSSALGAGSATADPLVCVLGDLAYYHDMNGLLSVARCGVDATIVLVNNDGGGIFHLLPIEAFDPPFTSQFVTPHGLDFEPSGDLYGLDYERVADAEAFETAYRASLASEGTQVIEVVTDTEASHRFREELHERVCERVPDL